MHYKYRYELKKEVKVDDDREDNSKQKDPYGDNMTMEETNPAYGTATTIKMDTKSAYATAIKIATVPACIFPFHSIITYVHKW